MLTRKPSFQPGAQYAGHSNITPGSTVKAVCVGLAVDVGGTVLCTFLFAVAYGIYLATTGTALQGMAAKLSDPTSALFVTNVLLASAWSVLGGYVCARIAKRAEYRLAAIMGIISTVIGLIADGSRHSLVLMLVLTIVTFGALFVGARLGRDRNRAGKAHIPTQD